MKMKERVKGIACGISFIVLLIIGCAIENSYIRSDLTVVHYTGHSVVVQDRDGNRWTCKTDKRFSIGEKVKCKFDNNDTDNRDDDILIKVK